MGSIYLSDGEWKLMKALWRNGPCTITQLVILLKVETNWSKHTIITMLGRLEKKGALAYEEGGKAKLFYPIVKESEVTIDETKGFLDKVYNGSISLLINTLVGNQSISKEELDELHQILQKAEVDQIDRDSN
ncbi:BlaI/MecI/CopY family transcriptional regulator [Anaeromicropila herbilytica]|uniref:Uracil phosphoribosyltransferase n=1 Tax=Anaeromicropila herbilytica TaxID=2785025 RepID=A0A7R7ELX7_9FIRM|nr:BlaI/MecI/CopY family transcriptional regulator [Anaeromicropila herbilytica]BCN30917.1 uracil phosphoribosyltransferase [Anaeromicropila herbilytica]